jgi:hypothetical protein
MRFKFSVAFIALYLLSWPTFPLTASPAASGPSLSPPSAHRALLLDDPSAPATPTRLVFIHHSVGDDWLSFYSGDLGTRLGNNNYFVSDTYYEWGPDGIGSETDIGHWWIWFRGPSSPTYMEATYNTANRHADYTRPMANPGGDNEIILFKSCYPNSYLGGSPNDPPTVGSNPLRGEGADSEHHTVGNAKGIYNDILQYFATRQDKLFVVITAPPLALNESDPAHGVNARAFNNWLVHDWLDGYPYRNVAVFDFYNVLSSNGGNPQISDAGWPNGNHHRWWQGAEQHVQPVTYNFAAYCSDSWDSHPTAAGLQKATQELLPLLNVFYHRWKGAPGAPTPTATRAQPAATASPTPTLTPNRTVTQGRRLYLPIILKGYHVMGRPTPTRTATVVGMPTATRSPTAPVGGCPAYPPGFTFVTDHNVYSPASVSEPPPRQWFTDPTFGTCLVRVTDRQHDPDPEDTSTGMVNEYSRVQAFNAEGTRLIARGTEGTWYLYDAQTLRPLQQLPLAVEPRWDATNPHVIYYSDETRLMSYNTQTSQHTTIRDFQQDFPGQSLSFVWTRYEGSPSRDTRYWGLMAQDQEWETVAFVVYDRQTNQVTIRDMRGVPGVLDGIDSVTISPLGTYFLAYFDLACQWGQLGTDERPCGLMVYGRNLAQGRGLLRIVGHSDPALDAEGHEVLMYQDIDTDDIAVLDLASGAITNLWPIDFSYTGIGLHFSGLAYSCPGWAVVSTHDDDAASHTWMDDGVFAMELKAGGRVVRLAHTQSICDESQPSDVYYWAEPHASTNPDLTRVVFTTNWRRYDRPETEMYMIALPANWTAMLP